MKSQISRVVGTMESHLTLYYTVIGKSIKKINKLPIIVSIPNFHFQNRPELFDFNHILTKSPIERLENAFKIISTNYYINLNTNAMGKLH